MKKSDYSISDIYSSLSSLGLESGDTVFVHSNIGLFGRCGLADTSDVLCEYFYLAIMDHINPGGTLIVPTFTYSYPRKEVYNNRSPTRMGLFSEFIRKKNTSIRSDDPCYSVAACGDRAEEMTVGVGRNSFGSSNSFFSRFVHAKGKILNLNFDIGAGSTLIHFFERKLDVPYRFDKRFLGTSILDGRELSGESTIYVHYLHPSLVSDITTFDNLARKHGMFRTAKLGRGEMGVISADHTHKLIAVTLVTRPWFLTKAEITGVIPTPEEYLPLR